MKITALDPHPQRPDWWHISVDGAYVLSLDGGTVVAEQLMAGMELGPERLERLKSFAEESRVLDRALRFLELRPRSRVEVRRRLLQPHPKRPTPPAGVVDRVLDRLAASQLLDDRAFAEYWVEQREQFSPRSAYMLSRELRQRGVDKDTAERAVEPELDAELALRAARPKARTLQAQDYDTFRSKLGGFLQRRGFGYGIVRETVHQLWEELHGEQPDAEDEPPE